MQRIRADRRRATTGTAKLSALLSCLNIEISYSTLHRIVRYELQRKLKVPRPIPEKQAAGVVEAFWSFLPKRIEGLIREIRHKHGRKPDIFYWCQDETRVGFRTESGRKITLKGVKPEQELQWHYDYYYFYGLIEPITGKSCLVRAMRSESFRVPLRVDRARGRIRFFYEFSHFNSYVMSIFLEKFQQENQDAIHIIQLDNAPIHTAKKLNVPDKALVI